MITTQQIKEFEVILQEKGTEAATLYAKEVVQCAPHSTGAERGSILNSIKPELFSSKTVRDIFMAAHSEVINNFFNVQKGKEKAIKKAKKANQASIKKTCESILACFGLSDYECKFLNDIKTKRKLTEKQIKWLLDLASKHSIEVKGQFAEKSTSPQVYNCDHEDLGSLGYTHGTVVKCPHCGQMAEVW